MAMEFINEANEAASKVVGFRFSPSDEELVMYYLRNKVIGRPHRFDVIAEIDIYKSDPWELPAHSPLQNGDNVWFFFIAQDKKLKRATPTGYWKVTGKPNEVKHRDRVVGTKKFLVFHSGRAPNGTKTSWVMREYRLCDPELQNSGIAQDAYVLCKIIDRTESGPGEEDGEDEDQQVVAAPEMNEEDNDDAHKIDAEAEPESSMPPSKHQRHEPETSLEEEDTTGNKRLKAVEPPYGLSSSAPYFGSLDFPLNPSLSSHSSRQVSTSAFTSADLDQNVPPKYIDYLSTLENQICILKREVEDLKAEAAEARSSVGSLQSRVDDLTMESMMLTSRASKSD